MQFRDMGVEQRRGVLLVNVYDGLHASLFAFGVTFGMWPDGKGHVHVFHRPPADNDADVDDWLAGLIANGPRREYEEIHFKNHVLGVEVITEQLLGKTVLVIKPEIRCTLGNVDMPVEKA